MLQLEKVHIILDEMLINGCIVETSGSNVLSHLQLIEKIKGT